MFKKMIWLSLVNIKRRASLSILFIILSLVVSAQLFLILITSSFLMLPESSGIRGFFYTTGFTSIVLIILAIPSISFLYCKSRYQDYMVYKMFGINKIDIILTFLLEISILTILGSIIGSLIILFFISTNIIFLPDFIKNIKSLWSLKLISIAIKSVFGVSLTTILLSSITFLLKFNHKNLLISGIGE